MCETTLEVWVMMRLIYKMIFKEITMKVSAEGLSAEKVLQ